MGWEHQIAKEFKKRDNPQNYAYFTGDVLSPVPKRLPDGTIIYEGPTIISCFEGAIMLRSDRLLQIPKADGTPYCAGETVALLYQSGEGLERRQELESLTLEREQLEYALERAQTDIDLREDADYSFQSNGYEIHLQVRDGAIAFVDSPCPDHVCEQFGQLSEVYDWAACIPAQAMLTIEPVE